MEKIFIKTEFIKLQQVLKLAGVVGQGSDSKIIISNGDVKVNNQVCFERGKKIFAGDIIQVFNNKTFKIFGE